MVELPGDRHSIRPRATRPTYRRTPKKKLTKGAIAAAAGVTLLLSGGGTLAYWNQSTNVGAPAVLSAGNLALSQVTAPAWTIKHTTGTATAVSDIAAVKLVPGDELTFTGAYKIAAQGDNLAFKADITDASITAATSGTADTALANRLKKTAVYTINGKAGTTSTILHKKPGSSDYNVTIAVTLKWDFDDTTGATQTADNPAKLGKVNLGQFAVTATQVDGTTAVAAP